jgi:hypothetical protein
MKIINFLLITLLLIIFSSQKDLPGFKTSITEKVSIFFNKKKKFKENKKQKVN